MHLSLRQAAKEAGVAKTTIIRALRTGRLSAQKNDLGDWAIDPAELHRVFPFRAQAHALQDQEDQGDLGCAPMVLDRDALPQAHGPRPPATTQDRERLVALEAENKALRELVARLDRDKADLQTERDKWSAQAERLALAPPRRSWWWFRRAS
jgi:hypothetical protein